MLLGRQRRAAFSLIELTVTLLILVAVAGLVIPQFATTSQAAERSATLVNMCKLRDILIGTPDRPGYLQDMQSMSVGANATGIPDFMHDLLIQPAAAVSFNVDSKLGWRGPYVANATGHFTAGLHASFAPYGLPNAPAVRDGWGNPIVLQWPNTVDPLNVRAKYVRLISAGAPSLPGANGKVSVIETLDSVLLPEDLTPDKRGNDIVVFLRVSDPYAPDVFSKAGP